LVVDDLAKSLEMAVLSTIDLAPKEKAAADAWLDRNLILGRSLKPRTSTISKDGTANFKVGGYAYVPNRVEPWTVVLEVNDKLVKLWDFEESKECKSEKRGFMRSFVMPFQSCDTTG